MVSKGRGVGTCAPKEVGLARLGEGGANWENTTFLERKGCWEKYPCPPRAGKRTNRRLKRRQCCLEKKRGPSRRSNCKNRAQFTSKGGNRKVSPRKNVRALAEGGETSSGKKSKRIAGEAREESIHQKKKPIYQGRKRDDYYNKKRRQREKGV